MKHMSQPLLERGVDASVIAYSGATAVNITQRLPFIRDTTPSHVILHAADIDIRLKVSVNAVSQALDNLIHSAKQTFPMSNIVVSAVPLPNYKNNELRQRIRQISSTLRKNCENDLQLSYLDNEKVPLAGNIHISAPGRELFARNIVHHIGIQHTSLSVPRKSI